MHTYTGTRLFEISGLDSISFSAQSHWIESHLALDFALRNGTVFLKNRERAHFFSEHHCVQKSSVTFNRITKN